MFGLTTSKGLVLHRVCAMTESGFLLANLRMHPSTVLFRVPTIIIRVELSLALVTTDDDARVALPCVQNKQNKKKLIPPCT